MRGIVQVQGFETGLARRAFCHAEQDQIRYGQFIEYVTGHGQLAFTAIHQQDIRQLALPVLQFAETSGQCLVHRRVIIAGRNAFDVVPAVVGLDRAFGAEDHAGRHCRLATGMTDVVALQALWRLIQLQHLGQCVEARRNVLTIRQARTQRLLGIGHRQLLPACSRATHAMADGQFTTAQLVDGRDQCWKVIVDHIDDQLAGQVAFRAADEVLAKKRGHDFRNIFFNTDLREEVLAAQHPPAPHADQVHTGTARVDERGDHIDVPGPAFHALLVLNPAQQRNLVPQLGRSLELQIDRRFFHPGRQLVSQRAAASFKKHHRVAHVFGVHLGFHQPDAGCLAAFDLVLQARTGAVLVIAVFALTNEKRLLQQAQTFADRAGAGVRTEILALGLFRTAMNAQARKLSVGEKDIGVGFVVAQQDVIGRAPFLDQRLLKQQGFGFVGGDRRLDLGDTRYQCGGLGGKPGLAKVTRQAILEVLRLADVKQPRFAVEHAVHAGAPADGRQKGARIKGFGHFQRLASTMP
ncbi:hypothetical protein D3C72_1106650 [compost metagenome]